MRLSCGGGGGGKKISSRSKGERIINWTVWVGTAVVAYCVATFCCALFQTNCEEISKVEESTMDAQ